MLVAMTRIAIVGGGNMGEALLSGLLSAGRPVKDLVVAEKMPEQARRLADSYSVLVTSVEDAVENAAVVVIAVKPTDVGAVVAEIAKAAQASDSSPEQVLVTIAAGVSTGYLESRLPAGTSVVRVMPNTPARVGAGVSALSKGRHVSDEQLRQVVELFDCVGKTTVVPEGQLDAVTAVSGSGPAYFFLMVEALVDAAVGVGLNRRVATELAVHTMFGSAEMLLARLGDDSQAAGAGMLDTSPAQLRASVTSPGGTTAAALRELERGGLRAAVDEAVRAAKACAEQLRVTSE